MSAYRTPTKNCRRGKNFIQEKFKMDYGQNGRQRTMEKVCSELKDLKMKKIETSTKDF